MTSTVRWIDRDGVRLYARTAGRGMPGIIFVHGWGCDHSFFGPQIEHFSRSHATVTVDQRGYGKSSVAGPFDAATYASDLLDVSDDVGFDRPLLIGHSMGGAIVAEYAARYPDRAAGLVLLDRAIVVDEAFEAMIHEMTEQMHGSDPLGTAAAIASALVGPDDGEEFRERWMSHIAAQSPDVLTGCMDGFDGWDGDRAAKRLAVPTLFIFASMYGDTSKLRGLCPHVDIAQTFGAGHFNHLIVPDQVNAMIDRFLDVRVQPFLASGQL